MTLKVKFFPITEFIRATLISASVALVIAEFVILTALMTSMIKSECVTLRYLLQVRVGNTTYYIGELELAQSADRFFTSLPFTVSVASASGILLTVIVIICVAYRHKSRQSERIVRRMQTQMDGLEARVANECKEGLYRLRAYCIV